MSKKPLDSPEGYEHVLAAAEVLDGLVDDVFRLPEVAEARAKEAKEKLGDDHGDNLLCGCWAAATLAAALLQLLGRHIDAALVLTQQHAAFAPPVQTLARTVIEQGMRITWLLSDDDVHTRERRFYEFEKAEQRHAKNLGQISEEDRKRWEKGLAEFLSDLPGDPQTGIPRTESLCDEFDKSGILYRAYRMFSQPIHGTASGASVFHVDTRLTLNRLGQGTSEWLDSEFVSLPLVAMWEAASLAMLSFRDLLAPDFDCPSLARKDDFDKKLKQVPPNIGWQVSQSAGEPTTTRLKTKPRPNRAQRRKMAKLRRQKRS